MKSIMGFIPAGGQGSRMKPFNLIKELIPVVVKDNNTDKTLLLIENAIDVLAKGNVESVVCTINRDKEILMRIMSDYVEGNKELSLSYVVQKNLTIEYGLPFAIAAAASFLRGHTVFMKFPDTIVNPLNCFQELYQLHKEKKSDLTLGVFNTEEAKNLGPVLVDENNKVILIEDKPSTPSADNTWNILIWEDPFLDLVLKEVKLFRQMKSNEKEILIYDIILKAINNKLRVHAKIFRESKCIDISCINDAKRLWVKSENDHCI